MELLWFIPAYGDGRYLGTTKRGRAAEYGYYKQVAQAADYLGYTGVLLPTGQGCEDPWVLASALAAETEKLKFLVAVRPGLMSPTVAARMASTFDRISDGRLLINVVAGGIRLNCKVMGYILSMMKDMKQRMSFKGLEINIAR